MGPYSVAVVFCLRAMSYDDACYADGVIEFTVGDAIRPKTCLTTFAG